MKKEIGIIIFCLFTLAGSIYYFMQSNRQVTILEEHQKMLIENNLKLFSRMQNAQASFQVLQQSPTVETKVIEKVIEIEKPVDSDTPALPQNTPTHRTNLTNFYVSPTSRQLYINWDSPLFFTRVTNGISMQPYFGENSLVIYQQTKPEDIKAGDIIIFENSFGTICHRVTGIGVDEAGWYAETKGDNNPVEDILVTRSNQLKGVVIGIFW